RPFGSEARALAEKAAQRLGVLLIALEDCKRAMPASKGFLYGLGATPTLRTEAIPC
ncbi:MAG: hypothetical protein RLZZ613_1107, partial [Pseudomonadota bacterium]